ncbi:TGRM2 protein, partial [Aramus guarauna]|nr:TGRM2 protein [Aramus guarauna]
AQYHAPVAVYCGSVPKFKPRYTALRGGSIDLNLQFCGSSWTAEEEAEIPPHPRTISPMEGRVSKASVHDLSTGDGDDLSHLSPEALTPDSQERRVNSTAVETIQVKDKLKMRTMSEDLSVSQTGLTDCSDPKEVTLKPVVSSSTSQRLLVNSKPVSPIQNSLPSSETGKMSNGEQEEGENDIGCDHGDGSNDELMSERKGYQASPLPCSGGDGKKSLRVALIPPVPKSARPSHRTPGSAAVPLPRTRDLDFQEDLEMWPRSGSSSSKEKTLKHLDHHTLEPISPVEHHVAGDVKSAEHLCEPMLPLTGLPLSQAKEMDHLMSPHVLSDDDFKDSKVMIHVTLSKSAQKKIQQKRMKEMEFLHRQMEKEREKEKSLQFPTQTVDPGDEDKESFCLPPLNGTGSSSLTRRNVCKEKSSDTALKKRVNRPSLPSIPVVKQGGRVPRKSSVTSLPAIALDFLDWGDEAELENARGAKPFPHPQQELLNTLTWLRSDDWEQKARGLFNVRRLAICHSEVLLSRLHDVSLAVTKEVNNLRTKVSRFAIGTLGELFRTMKKHMDHEVDMIAQVLLHKMGDTSEFIQKGANRALAIMVGSVTPARAMTALMASGIQHRNVLVRKCAAEHLVTVIERIGAEKLLAGTRVNTEVLVRTLVKLAQDCHQDTRCYGRKMLNILMSHEKFKYFKQTFPSRDLEDVMAKIKQKGIEDYKCELPPVKDHRKSRKSNLTMAQDNLSSDGGLKSGSDMLTLPRQTLRRVSLQTAEDSEQLRELCKLLTAKDFQPRMEGVALLLDLCKSSHRFISTNIIPIFDIFALRLQDCNKKVNQQALEALAFMIPMLRGALHPVLVSLVTAVTENLNSKHSGIYAAAVKVLEASIAHIDSTMLLQALAHRVRSLSGQALLDVAEHISVLVASVYPLKPQAAKRYALPTLWYFLGNSVLPVRSGNVRAVVTKLAKTLYKVMGSKLMEHAAKQPQHVAKALWNVLDLN